MLTPAEWERRLTFHYLHSDGPLGGAPLTFLDATPAELAAATVDAGLTEDTAQAAFLAQFERARVQAWLNGSWTPSLRDVDTPGYFRYLVLTALVSATEENVGGNHDFRDRLGALFGGGRLNSVAAVNTLWRALSDWTSRRQALGEPIRTVVLPSPGNMSMIGYAIRIAFPAWRDRAAFAKILRTLPPEVRRHPEWLLQELARPQRRHSLPAAVADAMADFERQLRAKRRMLLGHRFWTLVQSIDAQLSGAATGRQAARWRLEARFSGWDEDDLDARVSTRPSPAAAEAVLFEGGLPQLVAQRAELPAPLADALDAGRVLLHLTADASWAMDDGGPRDDGPGLILTREPAGIDCLLGDLGWKFLGAGWSTSRKLAAAEVAQLIAGLGLPQAGGVRLRDLTLEGGVRTGRSAWLGRPGFLPIASVAEGAELIVERLTGTGCSVTAEARPPAWDLSVTAPTEGRWKLIAREGGVDTVRPLVLDAQAPERWTWPEPSAERFEPETELRIAGACPSRVSAGPTGGVTPAEGLLDVLEAIYAGASAGGWAEADLVALLAPRLPRAFLVWEVLRAWADGGWIAPYLARGWRARRWRLRPPTIVAGASAARVEGAVGAQARARLEQAVEALGGCLVEGGRVSAWAPPALQITGVDAARLAADLGWRCAASELPDFAAAPLCWPAETRTEGGRERNGLWSFELGLFLAPITAPAESGVQLERWVRERRDDRDLFVVRDGETSFRTTSRTAAILEAHRLARRPLFRWAEGRLVRRGRSGHLPIAVAQALALRSGLSAGPSPQSDGTWTYVYGADARDVAWLAAKFGPAIEGTAPTPRVDRLARTIAARRTGRRLTWYSPPHREPVA
jgi:hypothetical protein